MPRNYDTSQPFSEAVLCGGRTVLSECMHQTCSEIYHPAARSHPVPTQSFVLSLCMTRGIVDFDSLELEHDAHQPAQCQSFKLKLT